MKSRAVVANIARLMIPQVGVVSLGCRGGGGQVGHNCSVCGEGGEAGGGRND